MRTVALNPGCMTESPGELSVLAPETMATWVWREARASAYSRSSLGAPNTEPRLRTTELGKWWGANTGKLRQAEIIKMLSVKESGTHPKQ